jgi:hypothetical protein
MSRRCLDPLLGVAEAKLVTILVVKQDDDKPGR